MFPSSRLLGITVILLASTEGFIYDRPLVVESDADWIALKAELAGSGPITQVAGAFTLTGTSIVSGQDIIDFFSYLERVVGPVFIVDNTHAAFGLTGFSNIRTIHGELTIARNRGTSTIAFKSIKQIDGNLTISELPSLLAISGFSGLTAFDSSIKVIDCSRLKSIDAWPLITKVSDVTIRGNTVLESITAFTSVIQASSFIIASCPKLTTVDTFDNGVLREVGPIQLTNCGASSTGLRLRGFRFDPVAFSVSVGPVEINSSEVAEVSAFFATAKALITRVVLSNNSRLGGVTGFVFGRAVIPGGITILKNTAIGILGGFNLGTTAIVADIVISDNDSIDSITGFEFLSSSAADSVQLHDNSIQSISGFNFAAKAEVGRISIAKNRIQLSSSFKFAAACSIGLISIDSNVISLLEGFKFGDRTTISGGIRLSGAFGEPQLLNKVSGFHFGNEAIVKMVEVRNTDFGTELAAASGDGCGSILAGFTFGSNAAIAGGIAIISNTGLSVGSSSFSFKDAPSVGTVGVTLSNNIAITRCRASFSGFRWGPAARIAKVLVVNNVGYHTISAFEFGPAAEVGVSGIAVTENAMLTGAVIEGFRFGTTCDVMRASTSSCSNFASRNSIKTAGLLNFANNTALDTASTGSWAVTGFQFGGGTNFGAIRIVSNNAGAMAGNISGFSFGNDANIMHAISVLKNTATHFSAIKFGNNATVGAHIDVDANAFRLLDGLTFGDHAGVLGSVVLNNNSLDSLAAVRFGNNADLSGRLLFGSNKFLTSVSGLIDLNGLSFGSNCQIKGGVDIVDNTVSLSGLVFGSDANIGNNEVYSACDGCSDETSSRNSNYSLTIIGKSGTHVMQPVSGSRFGPGANLVGGVSIVGCTLGVGSFSFGNYARVDSISVLGGSIGFGSLNFGKNTSIGLAKLVDTREVKGISFGTDSKIKNVVVEGSIGVFSGFRFTGLSSASSIGSVRFSGSSTITGISGFVGVGILGDVIITGNDALEAISGFTASFSIGKVTILENPALSYISAFAGTGSANILAVGDVLISSNEALREITGFTALTTLGEIKIVNNSVLANIAGFDTAVRCGAITIMNNQALVNITGFAGEAYISSITIALNPSLVVITGFENTTGVDRAVTIRENPALRDVSGFSSLESTPTFTIVGSPELGSICGLAKLSAATSITLDGIDDLRRSDRPTTAIPPTLYRITALPHAQRYVLCPSSHNNEKEDDCFGTGAVLSFGSGNDGGNSTVPQDLAQISDDDHLITVLVVLCVLLGIALVALIIIIRCRDRVWLQRCLSSNMDSQNTQCPAQAASSHGAYLNVSPINSINEVECAAKKNRNDGFVVQPNPYAAAEFNIILNSDG